MLLFIFGCFSISARGTYSAACAKFSFITKCVLVMLSLFTGILCAGSWVILSFCNCCVFVDLVILFFL